MFIEAGTLDDLLRHTLKEILDNGTSVTASRGTTTELRGVLLKLTNPRSRLSLTEEKGKVFSALGELAWYLAGSNDGKFIIYYITKYKKEMEDDGTIHGAYGPRLFGTQKTNQFENVFNLLREKSTSRQAVIQIFEAGDLTKTPKPKDVPCTCSLQFMTRNGFLDMVTVMRSNDVFLGLPHDVFSFTMLQEILARRLHCEPGVYSHFAGSLHLYDENRNQAEFFLGEGWQTTEHAAMPPMPLGDPMPSIQVWLKAEAEIREGQTPTTQFNELNPYWKDLVRLLQVYKHSKSGDVEIIPRLKNEMAHPVYREYINSRERMKGI